MQRDGIRPFQQLHVWRRTKCQPGPKTCGIDGDNSYRLRSRRFQPAVSTRSMGLDEMKLIGSLISKVLTNPGDEDMIARIKAQVAELCDRFPLYSTR